MLDSLYENIGDKIKKWAKWIFVIEATTSVISGFFLMIAWDFDNVLLPLLIIIFGPIIAFVSTWILYAFGQLVDDVHAMRNKEGTTAEVKEKREAEERARYKEFKSKLAEKSTQEIGGHFIPNPSKPVTPNKHKDGFSCPKCGCTLKKGQKECLCSWQIDWSKYE